MPGSLFVVATPIGNLEDLTFRALRTLKEVDLIAAEDTRRTAKLLAHYEIRKPMVSLREHNEHRETPRLVARLQGGETIALVSDAGTPGIADPGARLVAAAHEAGIRVTPIPGPSAVTAALSAAGVLADEFVFMGFVPRSGVARDEWFDRLETEHRTVVFFESPHRVSRTLADLSIRMVTRPIKWFREVSKLHEQLVVTPNMSASASIPEVGEFVAVVSPSDARSVAGNTQEIGADVFDRLTNLAGFSIDDAAVMAAHLVGATPNFIRKAAKKRRILVKQQSASRS
jgi:16S rRNA (cytidine1402-2'-O)-methyltransferase